ncbi:MAG: flagellar type III secretion system pore protein FliP [Myxococcaceae bacterium]|jgi:flagellar biosynthetic protein FliP|nr:flagellar type III secretion system pore protein FliP [Myxococcaceae bacterium]
MTGLVLGVTEAPLQVSLGGGSSAVKLFLLLTALSFATGALISITSFTRIVIVMSFLRQALGTPQLPPNQVIIALSLALTGFVMAPTFSRVHADAVGPYLDDRISGREAYERGSGPVLEFLLRQTRPEDLRLFYELSGTARPVRAGDVPLTIAVPAFMVSELTTAFRMGLFLFIPLLIVDLLVSAILLALGLMMVPPTLVSLPLKVGIFLLADGWHLLVQSLARSFS